MPVVLCGQQLPRGPLQKGRANPAHTAPVPSRVPFGIARGHPELGPHPTPALSNAGSCQQSLSSPACPRQRPLGDSPTASPPPACCKSLQTSNAALPRTSHPAARAVAFCSYPKTSSGTATPGHSQVLHTDPASVPSRGRIEHLTATASTNRGVFMLLVTVLLSCVHSDIPDRVPPWPRCFPQPFN